LQQEIEVKSNEGDENDEDHEPGRRNVKKLHDPLLPKESEVKEHYLSGHMPYRSWCHHCVRGRGRERDHTKKGEEVNNGIPEYHMDYCFPGDEHGERLTVLVIIERYTKMKKAVVVPNKGSTGSYAAGMVNELINECGDKDREIILKTDQEPAIQFLVEDVCVARTGARTIKETAPKHSKGSNGIVERAVQGVEQCLRTMKSSLDERMGVKVDVRHPVITWMCEFVSYMMNRMEVASDGKTPYERVKGKRAEVMGLEFAEKVLWKHHPGKKMEKVNSRWGYGIFIGVRTRSNELIVIDFESKDIKYVRTVRRIPEGQRWDSKNLELVSVVPWNRGQGDKDADGDVPEFDVKNGPGRKLTKEETEEIAMNENPKIVHRAHLRKTDFEKHGFTDRCPGCSAILRGLHVQPHSQACRARMEANLEKDVRIKNAKVRLQERAAKVKADENDDNDRTKRQKLDDIEDQAMKEDDPVRLAELFEQYRTEYVKNRGTEDEQASKRKKQEGTDSMQEMARGSQDPAAYEDMSIDAVECMDLWEHLERIPKKAGNAGKLEKMLKQLDNLFFKIADHSIRVRDTPMTNDTMTSTPGTTSTTSLFRWTW
jgi:hypothetical protein